MSIQFYTRKYNSMIDCYFILRDGPDYDSIERCMIGDAVSIHFDVPLSMANEINEIEGLSASSTLGEQWSVIIPFVVTERRHSFGVRADKVSLQKLGTTISVQAKSGYWEDVFLWIVRGVVPQWADKLAEPK